MRGISGLRFDECGAFKRPNPATPDASASGEVLNLEFPSRPIGRLFCAPAERRRRPAAFPGDAAAQRRFPARPRRLPSASRGVPSRSWRFPGPRRVLPSQSRDVPSPARELPGSSRVLPVHSRDVPGQSRELPDRSRDVPVPTRETTVHARNGAFLTQLLHFQHKTPETLHDPL